MTIESKQESVPVCESPRSSKLMDSMKLVASVALLVSSVATYQSTVAQSSTRQSTVANADVRRRLSSLSNLPTYMQDLKNDLDDRKKLFDETPPEEVKYWFEYTGPLQVSHITDVTILNYTRPTFKLNNADFYFFSF
jgi:hypothetical protein